MRRIALGALFVAALAGVAAANGRPPATSTIHFRLGHETDIYAGMTFGLLVSHDNGATWHWLCEKAVGYSGMYDPYYQYTSEGTLFATTFDGFKKNTDGCEFAPTSFGSAFVSADGLGADDAVYVAVADPEIPNSTPPHPGDSNVYKSTDNGGSYPVSAMPGIVGDWWQAIFVAKANPSHVYLSGFRFIPQMPRQQLLFKSVNGGASYTAMSTTGFTTSDNSSIEIVGVTSVGTVDTLYARVLFENASTDAQSLYKSTNGGMTWMKILTRPEAIHFVARANGDLVAATQLSGTQKSTNGGTTWTDVAGAPHINCLSENTAGELWACTLNYDIAGSPPIPADGYGIMKSTDLTTWTGVLKFQDILAPVDCPAGTNQKDMCEPDWCGLKMQLGITSNVINCSGALDVVAPPPKGCCDTGPGTAPAALAFGAVVALFIARPRRRRKP